VGSVFACLLAAAGCSVTALGRREHVRAIAERGLRVTGIWGEHAANGIAVAETADELAPAYDAMLITCKSFQTERLLADVGDRAGEAGVAISLQNGLGNYERVQAVCGRDRVLAGRVIFGAEIVEPALVRVTVEAEPVLLGRPGAPADGRVSEWARTFADAGIHCVADDEIVGALWGKVFYNAALNPLGALLGLSYGELAADAERRRVMSRVVEEAFAVARADGAPLAWGSAREYLDVFYGRLVPATARHRSSMLQDLERNRPTEIDAICGEVCRRGDVHGVDVALNRLLAMLVRARSGQAAIVPSRGA
jgi:2-dehydropantoate 2-reductase